MGWATTLNRELYRESFTENVALEGGKTAMRIIWRRAMQMPVEG